MTQGGTKILVSIVTERESDILRDWLDRLKEGGALRTGRLKEAELATQARTVLGLMKAALGSDGISTESEEYGHLLDVVADISRARAVQGFTPTDTATFIFSLKEPIFAALTAAHASDPGALAAGVLATSQLIDGLGLHTMEVFQTSREDVIGRQSREIAELSTPVVKLWDGILALPLIGTLDSARTQIVMENLLQSIVDEEADIAIIDITGVPTVDTLVAQHLLKTVAAARLMGAECIISGVRPQIAQTMVHLGLELNVVSKANLAGAFALALKRTGRAVTVSRVVRDASGTASPAGG